jgi:hypothetical protein
MLKMFVLFFRSFYFSCAKKSLKKKCACFFEKKTKISFFFFSLANFSTKKIGKTILLKKYLEKNDH